MSVLVRLWQCLVGQLTALKPCVTAALNSPGARVVVGARLKVRPGAGGGLQEAEAPASGFGSTVNTEGDDLTTGINGSFSESCPLLPIQSSQLIYL